MIYCRVQAYRDCNAQNKIVYPHHAHISCLKENRGNHFDMIGLPVKNTSNAFAVYTVDNSGIDTRNVCSLDDFADSHSISLQCKICLRESLE